MAKVKRPVGRPKRENPKVEPPHIRLTISSIEDIRRIAAVYPGKSFTAHIQQAVNEYIRKQLDEVKNILDEGK